MKISNITLLTLSLVMGSTLFVIQNVRHANGSLDSHPPAPTRTVPVPTIKPVPIALPKASLSQLHLDLSSPKDAGSYGRLSLDQFLVKNSPSISIGHTAPITSAESAPPAPNVIYRPRKINPEDAARELQRPIHIGTIELSRADAVSLPYLPEMGAPQFMDRVVDMAEASPLQPDARGCGNLKQSNLKAAPKHAKVRSVGMQRHLTDNTSVSVEYVYKDGCYKNAIATLNSLDMPGDDGVNLRVNMKF